MLLDNYNLIESNLNFDESYSIAKKLAFTGHVSRAHSETTEMSN
jgi:hypothetical protein